MKDERVTFFRKALEALLESLDATVRVVGGGDETIPELKESASRLVARLGTADRLAASSFAGNASDVVRVNAMRGAMRRLDAAYVTYRQAIETRPDERALAATTLGSVFDEVKADTRCWA